MENYSGEIKILDRTIFFGFYSEVRRSCQEPSHLETYSHKYVHAHFLELPLFSHFWGFFVTVMSFLFLQAA